MLQISQDSTFNHSSSKIFIGVRFVLLGFDPINKTKVLSKLVDGGGVDVGSYGPNCTHVIVNKLVYDDPTCVAARADGKILVTVLWVAHSLDVGMPVDPFSIMYRPLRDLDGISGANSQTVCLTGYLRRDRDDIMTMVRLMGANFSKPLVANKVTHLICYKFEGEKYVLAKKMKKIKIVNHRWLEDCLNAWEILPEVDYYKSGYELETMEAEAKDSEETAEHVNIKQHGEEAASPHQPQMSNQEVSRNSLVSSAPKASLDDNTNDKVSVTGIETVFDQAPNVHKIHDKNPEVLGSCCEPPKSHDRTETPPRIGNDPASTSKSAKDPPNSGETKFCALSYSRKINPSRTTPPMFSGEKASNLRSIPSVNVSKFNASDDFDMSSFKIEQAKGGIDFSCVQTPPKGTELLLEKRKMDVSSCGSSKLQKTNHNPKAYISESSLLVEGTRLFEPVSTINARVEINNHLCHTDDAHNFNETPKPLERKMFGKTFQRSKRKLCKGNPTTGSTYMNKTAPKIDDVSCSIGGKETEDHKFEDTEKLEMAPLVVDVDSNMGMEPDDILPPGIKIEGSSVIMDGETEILEDKEENESEAAVGEVEPGNIEHTVMEEKSEGVQCTRNKTDGTIMGMHDRTMPSDNEEATEQKAVVVKKKIVKEKTTKGKKLLSSKIKHNNDASVTKITDSNEAKSEKNIEKMKVKKEKVIKTKIIVAEKANRPIGLEDRIVNRGKRKVGKVGPNKPTKKIDLKATSVPNIDPAWFILSGHELQRKEFRRVIRHFKGRVCRDSHKWSYEATHFIVPDPIRRTEKLCAAAASGSWILKTDYLTASNQAGKYLAEEPYEWHKNGLSEDGAINLEAPRKWRLLRERTGHGAFYGMHIIVYGDFIAPPLDTLKRVIKAGDGTILATSPPYNRFLETGVDFAVVSPGMPCADMWVQEFLNYEIPCVVPDYLVEYVCKPGYSLDRHVQYHTHAWAEKSYKNLVNRVEEIDIEDAINNDLSCHVCGSRERGERMVICGDESCTTGCGVCTHIDCCDPPLEGVPEKDWFCPKCSKGKNGKKSQKGTRKGASVSKRK